MEFKTFTFKNGLRLVSQQIGRAQVGHLGITFNAGSRDENNEQQGLAHYLEHTLFKGTKKRKAFHILSRLDAVGGELNAFTTKEEICIYSSFQKSHLNRAAELLADVSFHSVFPSKEIEKEKDVILDEINGYLDSPSERIFDDFDELVYSNDSFGKNILGTPESVRSFTRDHCLDFFGRNFTPENAVVSYTGSASFERVVAIIEKHFSEISLVGTPNKRVAPTMAKGIHQITELDLYQSHVVLGYEAPSLASEARKPVTLLNNLLGGPGLNSLLNFNIREKYGIAYQIDSSYVPYTDAGQIQIYFATEKKSIQRCLGYIHKETNHLKTKTLSSLKLNQIKKQLIGHIALAQESNSSTMLGLGKSLLHFNKIESDVDVFKAIEEISAQDIMESANSIFQSEAENTLIFQ